MKPMETNEPNCIPNEKQLHWVWGRCMNSRNFWALYFDNITLRLHIKKCKQILIIVSRFIFPNGVCYNSEIFEVYTNTEQISKYIVGCESQVSVC